MPYRRPRPSSAPSAAQNLSSPTTTPNAGSAPPALLPLLLRLRRLTELPLHRQVNVPARVFVVAQKRGADQFEVPLPAVAAALGRFAEERNLHRVDPPLSVDQ